MGSHSVSACHRGSYSFTMKLQGLLYWTCVLCSLFVVSTAPAPAPHLGLPVISIAGLHGAAGLFAGHGIGALALAGVAGLGAKATLIPLAFGGAVGLKAGIGLSHILGDTNNKRTNRGRRRFGWNRNKHRVNIHRWTR